MIEAHVLDAWTRPGDRTTPLFGYLTLLGGFSAPLFLWLAGIGLVLSAERTLGRTGSRQTAALDVVGRGLEIFVLAFLFRLQAFMVSPGGPLITIFRVDILNVMGLAMVGAGLLWWLSRSAGGAVGVLAAAAAAVAMGTPLLRSARWVDDLPVWWQWYLRPAGEHTTFTLAPWSGFLMAGAAAGVLLARTGRSRPERPLLLALAGVGGTLVAIGVYAASLPSIYADSSFWTSSPTFFAIRVGLLQLVLALMYGIGAPALLGFMERLGRNSLFVYWIHVELVYGYATWALRRQLPFWALGLAYVAFVGLIYAAVAAKDALLARWRFEGEAGSRPRVV
jgi:uncharacterized membrane protein